MPSSHRDQILEGAIECVQTLGVAGTTTRDIAAAAGASLASIPYHFGSKDALMDQALLMAIRRYSGHVARQAFAGDASPLQALAKSLIATIDSFEEARPLLISLMEAHVKAIHSQPLRERVAANRRAAVERIAGLVRDGLELGDQLSDAEIHAVSVLVLALVDGLMLGWLIDPDATPSGEELLDAVIAAAGPLVAPGLLQSVSASPKRLSPG
ncbi:MAG: TetR/AcrR family transcriptional regulator [Solirubrobacterales bacterium]|jgi:AcrR family transcriptional regulator